MAEPLITIVSKAVPILRDNIDTDAIIPSREIKGVTKTGLSDGLFAGWRYEPSSVVGGSELNSDFLLNWPQFKGAQILLSGANFGCGSSREQAVWALAEYGFRVIVAESFGEIFYNNCIANGVLPIRLQGRSIALLAKMDKDIEVTLEAQTIGGISFTISEPHKHMLLNGLDAIDLTHQSMDAIKRFEQSHFAKQPWVQLK
ncbi:MAG: 3-isopropylmalate dehydratase small subunit [Robiginitomaculum sp.]|nr:3-isopropylmalate dehydratase small subunit [Robiginitomaculum sp.]